jgi:hypothetical protein
LKRRNHPRPLWSDIFVDSFAFSHVIGCFFRQFRGKRQSLFFACRKRRFSFPPPRLLVGLLLACSFNHILPFYIYSWAFKPYRTWSTYRHRFADAYVVRSAHGLLNRTGLGRPIGIGLSMPRFSDLRPKRFSRLFVADINCFTSLQQTKTDFFKRREV